MMILPALAAAKRRNPVQTLQNRSRTRALGYILRVLTLDLWTHVAGRALSHLAHRLVTLCEPDRTQDPPPPIPMDPPNW